jgi:hypothetical protein
MSDSSGKSQDGSKRKPLEAYGESSEERAAAAKAFVEAIETAGPDFGTSIKTLKESVKDAEPITVMGAMAMYIGSAEAGTNPEHDRPLGLFQHHLEIAQAALLRYGSSPGLQPPARHIASIASAVKGFNEAWIVLQAQKVDRSTAAERNLEAALMQLRVNSSTRRGWGYQSRMVPMLENLLSPLDSSFMSEVGFAPGALPGWWQAMAARIDIRLQEHRVAVREAWDWEVDDGWEERVARRFGRLPTSDTDKLTALAAVNDELRRGYVTQCSDLRAHEIYCFTLDDLVDLMPVPTAPEVVERIADSWSMQPGDDGGVEVGTLVLDNPVVGRPFIASQGGKWHLFCGWLLLHNPFELVERLLKGNEKLFDSYMLRRAEFLEQRTSELFRDALPDAAVDSSLLSTDPLDGKQYENDVLVRVSSFAVVAEAKGGRLPADARRGRGRPLRARIQELLVRPSEQGLRLVERLVDADEQVEFTRKENGETLAIDAAAVRRGIAVGITLEPVAEILPRLTDVAGAGLSQREADALAYSICLPDLELALDLLDHPSEILHYLGRRTEIERRTFLSGDEVDLLALYLQTGFNIGAREFSGRDLLDVTGLSDPIDVWHYRLEAGMDAEKPVSDRTAWWEAVLTRVEERKGPRWAEIGVSLCNVAPPEQEEFEEAMHELRRAVQAGERAPTDVMVFHNGPAQRRDVFCGIIATSPLRAEREKQYEHAARAVLAEHEIDRLTILAWTPKPLETPYFALILYDAQGT